MKFSLKILTAFSCCTFFFSCGQKTERTDATGHSVAFFNDSLFKLVEKIIPGNWKLTHDSAYTLVVISKDSLRFCNFTNAEEYAGDNYEGYIKDKIVDKKPFEIRFTFRDKLTGEQIKDINAANEKVDARIQALYKKYQLAPLHHKFNDFVPHSKSDSVNIANYKAELEKTKKEFRATPDFFTPHHSVYLSNNLPFPNVSLCDPGKEKEVEDLIYKIEGVLIDGK